MNNRKPLSLALGLMLVTVLLAGCGAEPLGQRGRNEEPGQVHTASTRSGPLRRGAALWRGRYEVDIQTR